MDLILLGKNFVPERIIDQFESLIWTERYNRYGDFELITGADKDIISALSHDKYLQLQGSDTTMVIEELVLTTDRSNNYKLKVTGRSLESILDRRIIGFYSIHSNRTISEKHKEMILDTESWTWYETEAETTYTVQEPKNFQEAVKDILNKNIINPADSKRKINNFKMTDSTDTNVTKHSLLESFTQMSVYDLISDKCNALGLGFKVQLNSANEFEFQLYSGTDRSYNQDTNPWIVFSPDYDNLLTSEFTSSLIIADNAAIVGGEGEDATRTFASCGSATGLNRREMFVDANDVSRSYGDSDDPGTYTDYEYVSILQAKGEEELKKVEKAKDRFQGEVDYQTTYILDRDFFLGDVVQIKNEFDMTGTARITEIMRSQDTKGVTITPTFESIEE